MSEEQESIEGPTSQREDTARTASRNILQERSFFFLLLAILAFLTLLMIWPNITAILAGLALVVIIKPLYDWYLQRKWVRGRSNRATLLTLLTFIFVIAIPVIVFFGIAYSQANALFTNPETGEHFTLESIGDGVSSFLEELSSGAGGLDAAAIREQLSVIGRAIVDFGIALIAQIAGFLSSFLISGIIILVVMMVLLPRFKLPERDELALLIPFPPDITALYFEKVQLMIMAMFKGTFVLAIIQGLAMGVVLIIAGVPSVFFLTVISMVLSLLPMIGISLIAWPIGIIMILSGQVWQGVFIILAFILIVANIDTALRPRLVPKEAYLNPALVLLSVFGGLSLMGFIGIFYGPVIMILLVTSVEVYSKYIMRSDIEPFLAEDGSLDLEKLGLRTTDKEGSQQGGILQFVQRVTARVSGQENKNLSS